jgi:hypothetical protein
MPETTLPTGAPTLEQATGTVVLTDHGQSWTITHDNRELSAVCAVRESLVILPIDHTSNTRIRDGKDSQPALGIIVPASPPPRSQDASCETVSNTSIVLFSLFSFWG